MRYQNFLLALFIFFVCLLFAPHILSEPDVGWHIKAGEIIISYKGIPLYDTLTFSSDQKWYNISWLWDVGLFIIYKFGNITGLRIVLSVIFAAIALTLLSFYKSLSKNTALVYLVLALSMLLIWDAAYLRPQLAAIIIATLFLKHLYTRKQSYIGPLVLTVLWVNIHGSFLLICPIMSIFIIQALSDKNYKQIQYLLVLAGACFTASFVNPLGYEIYYAAYRTLHSIATSYIAEWKPFVFGTHYGATLMLIVIIISGGFLSKSIQIKDKLFCILFLISALHSIRNFAFLGIFSAPLLLKSLDPYIKATPLDTKIFSNKALPIFIITFLAGMSVIKHMLSTDTLPAIPYKSIEFINQHCNNANVFNNYNIGGYLSLYLEHNKYFIDGRAGTAFSEKVLTQSINNDIHSKNAQEIFNEYNYDAAIINENNITSYDAIDLSKKPFKIELDKGFIVLINTGSDKCIL